MMPCWILLGIGVLLWILKIGGKIDIRIPLPPPFNFIGITGSVGSVLILLGALQIFCQV